MTNMEAWGFVMDSLEITQKRAVDIAKLSSAFSLIEATLREADRKEKEGE